MRPAYLLFLLSLIIANPALAKDEKSKGPTDKKHVLVDEIIDAVKAEKPTDEEKDELKKKGQERMDRFVDVLAEKTNMSPEDKQKLKDRLGKSCQDKQAQSVPPEVKAQIDSKLAIKEFCRDLSYQVMGDHFEDSDLKAILKFIKSPTGKKIIKQAPDMIAQMIELSAERYVPIAIDFMKQYKMPEGMGPGSPRMSPEQRRQMIEKFKRLFEKNAPSEAGKDET